MTNFKKITASPETLGEFLTALPVADGPWDASFQERFCASCEREDCDMEHCRNLQTLVCTAGKVQAIRSGNFHSNYPD